MTATPIRQYALNMANITPTLRLIPPLAEDFRVPGSIEHARSWAQRLQYLLVDPDTLPKCAHAFYMMNVCPGGCGSNGGGDFDLDHHTLWVPYHSPTKRYERPFILTQPYLGEKISDKLLTYAKAHGLRATTSRMDGWYGHGTLPVRLTIGRDHDFASWPIEMQARNLMAACQVDWDEDFNGEPWWSEICWPSHTDN